MAVVVVDNLEGTAFATASLVAAASTSVIASWVIAS